MRLQDIMDLTRQYVISGVLVMLFIAFLFCIGYFVVYKKICKGKKRVSLFRVVWVGIFICYMVVVLGATFGGRSGIWNRNVVSFFYSYMDAWKSASSSAWRNIVLNILLFVPMGCLIPIGFNKCRVFWKTYLTGFCISLIIESVQLLFRLGIFEIADLFNNTLGIMIGYGIFQCIEFIRCIYQKQKYPKRKLIFAQMPLLFSVLLFGTIYIMYQRQELGNLASMCIAPYDTKKWSITTSESYCTEETTAMVYKADILKEEETRELAEKFFSHLGCELDESRTSIYDETAFYWSLEGHSIVINYKGASYSFTDFDTAFPEEEIVVSLVEDADEKQIQEVLDVYGIVLPKGTEISYDEDSQMYTANVQQVVEGDKMYDGTLSFSLYENGKIGELMNSIAGYTPYKEFSLLSEEEGYQKICDGEFFAYFGQCQALEVGNVHMEYEMDTKGFYQPVYEFEGKVDGEKTSIILPAIANN